MCTPTETRLHPWLTRPAAPAKAAISSRPHTATAQTTRKATEGDLHPRTRMSSSLVSADQTSMNVRLRSFGPE